MKGDLHEARWETSRKDMEEVNNIIGAQVY